MFTTCYFYRVFSIDSSVWTSQPMLTCICAISKQFPASSDLSVFRSLACVCVCVSVRCTALSLLAATMSATMSASESSSSSSVATRPLLLNLPSRAQGTKISSLERNIRDLEDEVQMLKTGGTLHPDDRHDDLKQVEVYKSHSKFMKSKVETPRQHPPPAPGGEAVGRRAPDGSA